MLLLLLLLRCDPGQGARPHLAAVLGLQDVVDGVIADGGQADVHGEREGAAVQRPVVVCTQFARGSQALMSSARHRSR